MVTASKFYVKWFYTLDIYWNMFKCLLDPLCAIVVIFYGLFEALVGKDFNMRAKCVIQFPECTCWRTFTTNSVLTYSCELDPIIVAAMLSILLPCSHKINPTQLFSTRHCRISGCDRSLERLDELLILNVPRYWFVCFMTSDLFPPSLRLFWYLFIYCDSCNTDIVLAFGTQVRGFKPGRSRRIFQGEKILSTPPFGREVKPFVPCRIFTARKRTRKYAWKSQPSAEITVHFSPK